MGLSIKFATFVAILLLSGLATFSMSAAQSKAEDQPTTPVQSEPEKGKGLSAEEELPGPEDEVEPEIESAEQEDTDDKSEIDDIAVPDIIRDLTVLPFPARRMHELLLEAAKSGDIEKLRPYIGYGEDVTMLSLGGIDEDPISFLKSLSGDSEGHELLAILTEVLETGFVQMDEGTDQEIFVWPYFFAQPLDKLTPAQRVELFSVVTYGDYEDMKAFGAYIFYRVGITPEGRWRFFVAGD